jgi:protein gp37
MHPDCDGESGDFRKPRVFCASLADWLDDEVPIEWLADLLKLIHDTPNLDWLLLTKRPQNWRPRLKEAGEFIAKRRGHGDIELVMFVVNWLVDGSAPENVWIGTSVEDQQRANERIPELLNIPARIRFLSVEPMLGFINFSAVVLKNIQQVIFGGESGAKARVCNVDWIRDGVTQCRDAGAKVFVKQMGSNVIWSGCSGPGQHWPNVKTEDTGSGNWSVRLCDKKGGDMAEWPEDLRVREFPV